MRIAVCIKQVPDSAGVGIDPDTHTLKRSTVGTMLNPFDEFAVETALLLRDRLGGHVTALTMGPKRAEETLARAIAMGADNAILLSDAEFAGSDTWATASVIADALRKAVEPDLILFGKQAVDGDTAQVGPEVATILDWPQATYVSSILWDKCSNDRITVVRSLEDRKETVELKLPAMLGVLRSVAEPRFGTLEGRIRHLTGGTVRTLTAKDLGIAPGTAGLKGSPTRVVTMSTPEFSRGNLRLDGTPKEQSAKLVRIIREKCQGATKS